MFFIIGSTQTTQNNKKSKTPQYCDHCHNTEYWVLEKQKNWVSLFFIPVIPYKTKYLAYCPICRNGYEISGEMFDKG